MPPKKQSKKEVQRMNEEVSRGQQKSQSKKGTEKFSCICGKVYGSLAAVHTHINNKHGQQKKYYKSKIINPKKNGQPASTSIRMKDINYPQAEAELMCLADINLKNIHDIFKEIQKNPKEEILIDVNQDLSDDSDIDIDDLIDQQSESEREEVRPESKRQKIINEKVRELKEMYKLNEIDSYLIGAKQLESFRIQKFRLSVIRELSKFFVPGFASKIELTLLMVHIFKKHKGGSVQLAEQMKKSLDQIWVRFPVIKELLSNYYDEWLEIKNDIKGWKEKQKKKEEERQHE